MITWREGTLRAEGAWSSVSLETNQLLKFMTMNNIQVSYAKYKNVESETSKWSSSAPSFSDEPNLESVSLVVL